MQANSIIIKQSLEAIYRDQLRHIVIDYPDSLLTTHRVFDFFNAWMYRHILFKLLISFNYNARASADKDYQQRTIPTLLKAGILLAL